MEKSSESEPEVNEEEELVGQGGGISLGEETPLGDDSEDEDFQTPPLSPVITPMVPETPPKKRGRPFSKKSPGRPKATRGRKQRKRRRVALTQ